MASNLQHILANLEMAPPQGSWDQLSARLDAEYDLPEITLAQKLDTAALQPPASAWAAIASAIPAETEQQQQIQPAFTEEAKPAKVLPFSLKKIAVAAAVLGIIALGSWYLLRTDNTSLPPVQQSVATQKENDQQTGQSSPTQPAVAPPVMAQKEPDHAVRSFRTADKTEAPDNAANAINSVDIAANETPVEEITPANPVTVLATNAVAPATIADRPYRDARGKVVMDMNLLNNPGTPQYVTVTAPNGEQTRINKKFLPVLTFLNTGADNGQFNNSLKQRFQKWRNQLIQQASFVPSATNFLDIMELKELLQDK